MSRMTKEDLGQVADEADLLNALESISKQLEVLQGLQRTTNRILSKLIHTPTDLMPIDVRDPNYCGGACDIYDATGAAIEGVIGFDPVTGDCLQYVKINGEIQLAAGGKEAQRKVARYPVPLRIVPTVSQMAVEKSC